MKTTFLKINEQERLIDSFNSFGSQLFSVFANSFPSVVFLLWISLYIKKKKFSA